MRCEGWRHQFRQPIVFLQIDDEVRLCLPANFRQRFFDKAHLTVLDASKGFSPLRDQIGQPLLIVMSMVALVVLGVGMLGIAGLYVTTLRSSGGAIYRMQAVNLATDMADRIRANRGANVAYNAAAADNNCYGVGAVDCAPAAMAANDLFVWQAQVVATLPNGNGVVAVVPGAAATDPFTYTITTFGHAGVTFRDLIVSLSNEAATVSVSTTITLVLERSGLGSDLAQLELSSFGDHDLGHLQRVAVDEGPHQPEVVRLGKADQVLDAVDLAAHQGHDDGFGEELGAYLALGGADGFADTNLAGALGDAD